MLFREMESKPKRLRNLFPVNRIGVPAMAAEPSGSTLARLRNWVKRSASRLSIST
jgi:hypothetical protein